MDSLIIADMIEVLGSEHGVPSNLPECPQAVFVLDPGWDLGAPQPVSDITSQLSLDGERPYGRRASNRTLVIPVNIMAPDRKTLVAARETLFRAIDADSWPLKWTRDDSPNLDGTDLGQPVVFDCFRGLASKPVYSITDEQQLLCHIDLVVPALPYGRSAVPEILAFKTNIVAASFTTATPPDPILLDVYTSIAGGNPGWALAVGAYGGGDAAKFAATPGTTPQYVKVFGANHDLSLYSTITAHVGLATPADDIYVRSHGTNFSVEVTLVDASGLHYGLQPFEVGLSDPFIRGRTSDKTRRGEHGLPVYKKHPITIGNNLPPGFDITNVHGYSISFSDNPRGTVDFNDVFIGRLWAYPPTSTTRSPSVPVPELSRGIVYDLNGVIGTAQAPVSITGQQYTSTGTFTAVAEFSSADVWEAPEGTTEIQLEMAARGGSGAPTVGGGSIGSAGGGGSQYRQDPSMPTTPGTVYGVDVDADGNVSFTGDGGRVCTAAAGSDASGTTGGTGGTGGTDHAGQFHHDGGDGASVSASTPPDALWLMSQASGTSVTDSTGNGHTGTAANVTWSGSSNGGSFDGTNSEIDVAGPVIDTLTSFSVSAWVNLSSLTGDQTFVSQDGVHTSAFRLQYNAGSGNWRFSRDDADSVSPTAVYSDGVTPAATGTWTHLVGVWDSGTNFLQLYVDSVIQSGGAVVGWGSTGMTVIGRGKSAGSSADFTNGSISDVAVYNRLLSDSDVAHVFGEGRTGDGSTVGTVLNGGGGGSSGGPGADGNDGAGSAGGAAVASGGAGGNGGTPDSLDTEPGSAGGYPGGGGGGAAQDASVDAVGGEGGAAWVRMTYQQSIPSPFPNFIAHIPDYAASDVAPFYVPLASSGPEGSGTDLASGATLTVGGSITSPSNLFKMIVQSDGNVVVYNPGLRGSFGNGPTDWTTGTVGSGSANYLTMETDGNLKLHHSGGAVLWSSGTSSAGAHLELMPDGMLVIFDTAGNPLWSNRRFPSTNVTVSMQDVSDDGSVGFNARWNGTYSLVLSALHWANPTVQRTMTATITQYGFQGGLPYPQTLSWFGSPSQWSNQIVTLGEMTIPQRELPPENIGAYYTVSIDTGDSADRLLDALFFDTMGQTVTINVSGAGYGQYYIDEPTPERDIGTISGSMRDRKIAVGVMNSTFLSGGPLTLHPGNNQVFLYSIDGAPALLASYYPRWFVDKWDV